MRNEEFDKVRKQYLIQHYQDVFALIVKHRRIEELDIVCMQRGDDVVVEAVGQLAQGCGQ